MRKAILTLTTLLLTSWAMAQNNIIKLPAPSKTGGMPLMEALSKRATNRTMDGEKSLSQQQLSDLLWAAWGINREEVAKTLGLKSSQHIALGQTVGIPARR